MVVIEGTTEAVKTYVESQFRRFGRREDRHSLPFITISRQAGAGGVSLAAKLSEYLTEQDKRSGCPWLAFDKNLVEKVLDEHHLSARISEFMTEDKASEIRDTLEELFGLHPARWVLVHKTSETVLRLAQMGNVVLVGRGSNVVTAKLEQGFHVRLVGSVAVRTRHLEEYYGLGPREAAEFLKKEDQGRKDYFKQYFDKNIDDPLLYHLVINTDRVSYEEAARMIADHVTLQKQNVG